MPISSLHIANVGPFDEIEFEFDNQVNVFTGPNNSGKSSALWALGDITVYPFSFPEKLLRKNGVAAFRVQLSVCSESIFEGELPVVRHYHSDVHDHHECDEGYWTPGRCREHIEFLENIGYSKFIPALRRNTDFRSPGPNIVSRDDNERMPWLDRERLAQLGTSATIQHLTASINRVRHREEEPELKRRMALVSRDASLVSDQDVIQSIVELDYRSYLRKQPEFRVVLDKVGRMASDITEGYPIAFVGVNEDSRGFFPEFDTIDGVMPLNTLSQGTQSIIQWLAHLLIGFAEYYDFPENLEEQQGVLIIDEIDAHLHPSWQRRIVPTLIRHLPNLQIFCSTHSPLMLSGLKEGQIQLLQRDKYGKVTVSRNETDIIGWTADEILQNLQGIHNPTDSETAGHIERLEYLRSQDTLSVQEQDELEELRHTVSNDLLRGPESGQLDEIAGLLQELNGGSLHPFPILTDTEIESEEGRLSE